MSIEEAIEELKELYDKEYTSGYSAGHNAGVEEVMSIMHEIMHMFVYDFEWYCKLRRKLGVQHIDELFQCPVEELYNAVREIKSKKTEENIIHV